MFDEKKRRKGSELIYNNHIMNMPKIAPQHIIDDEAKQLFGTYFNMKNGFLVQKLPEDYGIDYLVELIDNKGQTSGICFNIQLKGTNDIKIKNDVVAISLKKSTLNYFSKQLFPTIVIITDITSKLCYWHNSFDFISDLDQRNPSWRSDQEKTATIYIPIQQDLSPQELDKLKQYVEGVYTRRSAIPQGQITLMHSFNTTDEIISIEDLSKIIAACDYERFFEVISANPHYYFSDINFSILFDLFEQIPYKKLYEKPVPMAIIAITSYKKGYHQESRKWCQLTLTINMQHDELISHIEAILNEIDFMYGYITEQTYVDTLKKISQKAILEIRENIFIIENRFNFWKKEKEIRRYGRFRSMELMQETIKNLRTFLESCSDSIKELVLLELAYMYSMVAPFLWSEIGVTMLLRNKVGLQLTEAELIKMRSDAENATNEASNVFNILVIASNDVQISLMIKAQGLLIYSQYLYQFLVNKYQHLIFLRDIMPIPEKIPPTEEEMEEIQKLLTYCQNAKNLFKIIGAKDKELHAMVLSLSFLEDLGEETKYHETKKEIEKQMKQVWVSNTVKLFEKTINEGSLRSEIIKNIASQKRTTDFDTANMSEIEIEEQVDCNSKTFNIIDKNKIENLRKDVLSNILESRYRINVCKHFNLLQDRRHSFSLKTIYEINPNRKGVCNLWDCLTNCVSPIFTVSCPQTI